MVDQTTGNRVLLVEDDDILRRTSARVLASAQFDVTVAVDGREAIAALDQKQFDVVLSDVVMPHMTGLDLLREVRKRHLELPVILVTGTPSLEAAQEAKRYGAMHYLTKPVDPERLVLTVKRAQRLGQLAQAKREVLELLGSKHALAGDLAGLEMSLAAALDTLWMAYQPIVRAGDGSVFGYEALMRCREPSLPHPGAILEAAEQLGRIRDVGRRVRALAPQPFRQGESDAMLFVNLHPADLLDTELLSPDSALASMSRNVVLEITERAALTDVKDAERRVAALREAGYRIAVDDLGAGYAGLSSVITLEPHIVKLDMSLIRGADSSPKKQRLVRSIAHACRDLGILVVAEGIETVSERDCLVEQGCELLQGYLFAKPAAGLPAVNWP